MDDDNDDKDDTKRKSRNLSEKKRRDQFNVLVNELCSMVTTNSRKMDKSTVLKSTILFLKNHNEVAVKSRVHEIQEDWKPSFLSNEEFTHLILEALDGFIMVFSSNGRIYYASENVTSLLGYLPSELANATIYEIAHQDDHSYLYNVLLNPEDNRNQRDIKEENQVSFTCHIKRGGFGCREENTYELVQFIGYFSSNIEIGALIPNNRVGNNVTNDTKLMFVGTGRLQTPQLIRDISFVDSAKSEFTSRHSLEWKFLFLDHRAPPIIGYLPFEVLGTSGYDYYHVDDLEKVVTCHESLMQKGEGTSCHYRFLTKGQQWIWLQTRFYIDYNQWNSKPEFIVCTHNVVSYTDVIKQLKKNLNNCDNDRDSNVTESSSKLHQPPEESGQSSSLAWSQKSAKPSKCVVSGSRVVYHGLDSASMFAGSSSSRHSITTTQSSRPKGSPANSTKSTSQINVAVKHRRQPEVEHSRVNYVEPIPSVVPVNFPAPAGPTLPISLPSSVLVNQQNIIMTTAQNQIQDELQRKHEELQQLIVHQQEELRRVSEQLLIARYGILSPLINVSLPYSVNPCQPAASCCASPNVDISSLAPTEPVQGLSVPPVSVTPTMPIVSMEPFRQSSTSLFEVDNAEQMISQQQQHHQIQQHEQQHQQQHPQHPQNEQHQHPQHEQHQHPHHEQHQHPQHTQHRSQTTHEDGPTSQMMTFQMCQQNDII